MKTKMICAAACVAAMCLSSVSVYAATKTMYAHPVNKTAQTIQTTTEQTTETTTETKTQTTTSKTKSGVKRGASSAASKTLETTTEETTAEAATNTESTTEATTEAIDEVDALVNSVPNYVPKVFAPEYNEDFTEDGAVIKSSKTYDFENGDKFFLNRFEFKTTSNGSYTYEFVVPGESISVRYVDPETKTWVNTTNLANLKHNTLFITTDKGSAVISVPAVYKNEFTSNTMQIMHELETPLKIEKNFAGYMITATYPIRTDCIGEIWALTSSGQLIDWSKQSSFDNLLNHDLGVERRWSWDGYYYKIPYNYIPYGDNMLYRNPANYTGALCVKLNDSLFTKDMGYIMTRTCMFNQNEQGFWATGPKSLWLETDFQIGENFYDTRFNTDFALSLIDAYRDYNNKEFLKRAVIYGNYLLKHAENNHYKTVNGGWLVEDYGENGSYTKTHVSLNHQLAEMNFLYDLYNITLKEDYKNTADTMLIGIDDTKDQWVLEDGNLKYALMYNGTANTMVDYPYLTYNDLLRTKQILRTYFNKTNDTINYLMQTKLNYMLTHNITGYNYDI